MENNYRSYQRVLNISVKPSSAALSPGKKEKCSRTKVSKPRKDDSLVKRRTKTGCFTCRKRKKKCDEDKVNGKCQACTRNFLECCWPEPATNNQDGAKELKAAVKTPTIRSTKCDINSLLSSPVTQEMPLSPEVTVKSAPLVKQSINPYPSPIQSPIYHQPSSPSNDVSFITLPPLRNINYKLQAKDSNVRGLRSAEKENSPSLDKSKEKASTKFIITSFDSRKDLCEIKN